MSRHWRKAKEMIETQTLNGPGLLGFFVNTNDFLGAACVSANKYPPMTAVIVVLIV